MAYDKHTWTCDEPITVERLNHIEDGIANAGGDCDCGFECEEEWVTLTEETVTTTTKPIGDPYGELSYSQLIDADTIKVTFNGTEYECSRIVIEDVNLYGGAGEVDHDFSTYPFSIVSSAEGNAIFTESTGTYTIKIEGMLEKVTTTTCFDKAVRSATTAYAHITSTMGDDGCAIMTLDITDEDLASIISKGQRLAIVDETTHSIIYPTFVYARNATVTPEPMQFRVIQPGYPLGIPTAMVTIAITANGDKEHLVTLYAYDGTASPRYLEGKMCVSEDPLIVPLDKDISAATTSSPVKSLAPGVYNSIMNALNNGVSVYLREQSSKEVLLVTACNARSGMTDATITVNIEKTDGTLGITYSKPIKFHFGVDGRCYYPMSAQ